MCYRLGTQCPFIVYVPIFLANKYQKICGPEIIAIYVAIWERHPVPVATSHTSIYVIIIIEIIVS